MSGPEWFVLAVILVLPLAAWAEARLFAHQNKKAARR